MRYIVLILSLFVLIGAVLFYTTVPDESGTGGGGVVQRGVTAINNVRKNATTRRPAAPKREAGGAVAGNASPNTPNPETDFPIAAELNAPNSTIARDLDLVRQLFETWQSNFPREGNPVGENADITAALLGGNRLSLALIPKGHRALNAAGELCDRWGTPFRFHQLSGTKMEIRSAGPDRRFATEDDAVWTPQ